MKTATALVAALLAGLSYGTASAGDNRLTAGELVVTILSSVGAYVATWAVPNAGTVSRAVLEREVIRARYSHTTYGGRAGTPPDADPLPPNERPQVQ